jgi:hypothetical protein
MLWRSTVLPLALCGVLAVAQEDSNSEAATEAEQVEAASDEPSEAVSDDEFVPTKEVPADDEITFPVDI